MAAANEIAFGQQRVVFMALFGKQIDNSTKRHADKWLQWILPAADIYLLSFSRGCYLCFRFTHPPPHFMHLLQPFACKLSLTLASILARFSNYVHWLAKCLLYAAINSQAEETVPHRGERVQKLKVFVGLCGVTLKVKEQVLMGFALFSIFNDFGIATWFIERSATHKKKKEEKK